jgi:N-acetylneuraminate synthase
MPMLLHCTSGYPTPVEQCNLAAIETIRERCETPVGWSDHSVNPAVIYRAVHHWGAEMVEFHLDLDGSGAEFAAGHCWLPPQIQPVIQTIRLGQSADGAGRKEPVEAERSDRVWRADPADGLRPMRSIRETWTPR